MLLQKARCNASAARASATRRVTAVTDPGSSFVVTPTTRLDTLPRRSSLNAVAGVETTRRTTVSM